MFQLIFLALGVLALSLVIAGFLMARDKALPGILMGAVLIALMVLLVRWSLQSSITRCLEEACSAAGLATGCGVNEFGCTEWTGMGITLITTAGWVDLVLYIIGVIVIAVVQSRRRDY